MGNLQNILHFLVLLLSGLAGQQFFAVMMALKDLREDHDLNQSVIAAVIGTTQQQYSKIESGKSDISGEKLILLAQYYNVSVDYILGLINDPKPLYQKTK